MLNRRVTPQVWYNLAISCEALGMRMEAREYYPHLLQIEADPHVQELCRARIEALKEASK